MRTIHGRYTNDYSPTLAGSDEETAAFNARREMMKQLDSAHPKRIRNVGKRAALSELEKLRFRRA